MLLHYYNDYYYCYSTIYLFVCSSSRSGNGRKRHCRSFFGETIREETSQKTL
jgi:hypothetical protein